MRILLVMLTAILSMKLFMSCEAFHMASIKGLSYVYPAQLSPVTLPRNKSLKPAWTPLKANWLMP